MSATVLVHNHTHHIVSPPTPVSQPGAKGFSWDTDPRWATCDADIFTIRKRDGELIVLDSNGEEVDVLENHPVYGAGDSLVVQYVISDGRPFATRARVIGYAGCEGALYVETYSGLALWISPNTGDKSTWIEGKPQIIRHTENNTLTLDVDHARVIRRLLQFSDEAPTHKIQVASAFHRCMTWICFRRGGNSKFCIAPALIAALNVPTRASKGLLIPAFNSMKGSVDKPAGVRARVAMEKLYPYGKTTGGPWNDRGRNEVKSFADQYGLRLRADFRVFQGHKPKAR